MIPCNRCCAVQGGRHAAVPELRPDRLHAAAAGTASSCCVPRHVVHRLPDGVSFAAGALVEPASCVLRGLERGRPRTRRDDRRDRHRHARLARADAGEVCTRPARSSPTASARRSSPSRAGLGADAAVARRARGPCRGHAAMRSAGGLDLVIETAGAVDAVELATRLVRPGGRVVLLGIAGEGKMLEMPADRIMFGDMDVIGSCSYPTAPWSTRRATARAGLCRPRPDRHASLPGRALRGGLRGLDDRRGLVAKVLLEHVAET